MTVYGETSWVNLRLTCTNCASGCYQTVFKL